jgi:hypothetical protein
MTSVPLTWTSAGSSFRIPVFAIFCRSRSKNFVWLQLPTVGASESAAFVFFLAFFAAPAVALAAEEPLLPMEAAWE